MFELKVVPSKLYPPCPTSFTCGRRSFTKLRLPHNPLFEVAKRIELAPGESYFDQMLEILNGDKVTVNIFCAEDVVRLAHDYFQAHLKIDCDSVGNALINAALARSDMAAFDSLSNEVLCNGIINAKSKPLDQTLLQRAIDEYLKVSIRSDEGKRMAKSLAENAKEFTERSIRI